LVAFSISRAGVADEFVKERTSPDLHFKIVIFIGLSNSQHTTDGCPVTVQKNIPFP
jgi:hypothetical protein